MTTQQVQRALKRLLKINVTALLESLNGRTEEIIKNIQNLYRESFIFRFKLNNQNLTEGKPGYLVKKNIPDDELEAKFLNDIKVTNFYYLFRKLVYYINIFEFK